MVVNFGVQLEKDDGENCQYQHKSDYIKYLQALTLVRPTRENLVPNPWAAVSLNNQLYMLQLFPKIDRQRNVKVVERFWA